MMRDAALIIGIVILCLFYCGEPDLHDAAISNLMNNECNANYITDGDHNG